MRDYKSDYEEEWDTTDIVHRAVRLEAKYGFYVSRFVSAVILTLKFRRTRNAGRMCLLKQLNESLRELERSVDTSIAWAIVEDRGKGGRLLCFHLVVFGTADIKGCEHWEFQAPHECTRRRVTRSDSGETARFLAKLGIIENNEFHFGCRLIEDDSQTPREMRRNTINPACKKVVERDLIALGVDPKCKRKPPDLYRGQGV